MDGNISKKALRSYTELNHALREVTLAQCYNLLDMEVFSLNRPAYVKRIIRRVVALEGNRLREQLEAKYL